MICSISRFIWECSSKRVKLNWRNFTKPWNNSRLFQPDGCSTCSMLCSLVVNKMTVCFFSNRRNTSGKRSVNWSFSRFTNNLTVAVLLSMSLSSKKPSLGFLPQPATGIDTTPPCAHLTQRHKWDHCLHNHAVQPARGLTLFLDDRYCWYFVLISNTL